MSDARRYDIRRIGAEGIPLMQALNALFGAAFEDWETYRGRPPGAAYLRRVLGSETLFALVAMDGAAVIGGLVAYELQKLEQERSEIYIYDLAVAANRRREGVATALIGALRALAKERGAAVVFVQADPVDAPAIALYPKLGRREDVLHFDIDVVQPPPIGGV